MICADGYREIRTSALTLRYRLGSGPFTATNVSVALTGTTTTANPSFPSYCVASAVREAENALPLGHAGTALDHSGYAGSAFVAGYEDTGSGRRCSCSTATAARRSSG